VCARHDVWLHVDAAYGGPETTPGQREALAAKIAPYLMRRTKERFDPDGVSIVFFAFPTPFTGFFIALASAGATHGPWAETTATPAHARSGTAATAMLSDFQNGLMTPPLALKLARHGRS